MSNKITISAIVNADVDKAWKYYTGPEHIVNWNFADPSWHCPSAENDVKVGGNYKASMEARDGSFGFDFEAVYTEVNEEESFTYEFGGRIAKVSFENLGDQTKVKIVFDPENENPIEMQRSGWQSILNNYKAYVEK